PRQRALLPQGGAGLRELLALPRADRPARGGAGGDHERQRGRGEKGVEEEVTLLPTRTRERRAPGDRRGPVSFCGRRKKRSHHGGHGDHGGGAERKKDRVSRQESRTPIRSVSTLPRLRPSPPQAQSARSQH